jgi:hypothetical protein
MAEPRSERSLEILAALEPLLDQALELGPAERELWLADLRADRPDVAEGLERLLAAEEELDQRGFLDHGSAASLKAGRWTGCSDCYDPTPAGESGLGKRTSDR